MSETFRQTVHLLMGVIGAGVILRLDDRGAFVFLSAVLVVAFLVCDAFTRGHDVPVFSRIFDETERRRAVQSAYNEENGITPEGIRKSIVDVLSSIYEKDYYEVPVDELDAKGLKPKQLSKMVKKLKKEIAEAAKKWDFEKAALLRDRLLAIEKTELTL